MPAGCAEQWRVYRACLKDQAVAGAERRPPPGSCDRARSDRLWALAEKADTCVTYSSYRDACPNTPEARFALGLMESLGCAAPPPTAALARAAQTELKRLGHYQGPVDGDWGPGSQRALAAYQSARGAPGEAALSESLLASLRAAAPPRAAAAQSPAPAPIPAPAPAPPVSEPVPVPVPVAAPPAESDLGAHPLAAYGAAAVRAAEAGDGGQALWTLADRYFTGEDGHRRDPSIAAALWRFGCDRRHPRSCNSVGSTFSGGSGAPRNDGEANRFFRLACDLGSPRGCSNLAWSHLIGRGVAQSPEKAFPLLKQACDSAFLDACAVLGELHYDGSGVERDREEGRRLFQLACEGGAARGCYNWGRALEYANLLSRDYPKATELYLRACDAGHPEGCRHAANMYETGRGVLEDPDRARALLEEAVRLAPDWDAPREELEHLIRRQKRRSAPGADN